MIGYYSGTATTGSCTTPPGWTVDKIGASLVEISAIINVAGTNRCLVNVSKGTCPLWGTGSVDVK